jgi:trimeric autotransporter adhesin
MSTKTTFKRVALVAVAALGLGVLSVAPSQATVSGLAVTVTNGSAGNSAESGTWVYTDSTTAATINIVGLLEQYDSVTVSAVAKTIPAGGTTAVQFYNLDSATPTIGGTSQPTYTVTGTQAGNAARTFGTRAAYAASTASVSETVTATNTNAAVIYATSAAAMNINHTFGLQFDSAAAGRVAGTYTWTIQVKGISNVSGVALQTITRDISLVVARTTADAASRVTTVDPSRSTAIMSLGSTFVSGTTSDSSVALVSTAASADQAVIQVVTQNATGTGVAESITATVTGAGVIGLAGGTTYGKSITVAGSGSTNLGIRADGTNGVGSIVIKTTSQTFPAKTVTFFAKSAKTITVAVARPVIGVGTTNDVLRATALDAEGNVWGGAAFIVADTAADALIAGSSTPAACTFNSARGYHECPVTGTAAGTAKLDVIDASTVALATATSAPASVRVTIGTPARATLAFDKATYAPGEKAQIWVGALDAAGLALSERTITNIFAAGGITSTSAFSTGSDTTLTDVSVAIAGATSATSGTVAGYKVYTVYMPFASGDVTISATGGTGLAAAGRVALSATASVVNSSVDAATDAANEATDAANAATDAALAAADAADAATAAAQDASDAVAALSASVSKLISSLRAQITSLTNLVIKIQKKVRA